MRSIILYLLGVPIPDYHFARGIYESLLVSSSKT